MEIYVGILVTALLLSWLGFGLWIYNFSRRQSGEWLASAKEELGNRLETSTRQLLEVSKAMMDQQSDRSKHESERVQMGISSLVKPLHDSLKNYQTQNQDLEVARLRSLASLEAEINRLFQTGQELSRQTAGLKDALKKPHVRGRWGEVQLKNCIELSGMSEYCDVVFQESHSTDSGARLIPDMKVRMPGDRWIIVDAKTPLDGFLASIEAPTEEGRAIELQRHGRQVREHIKKLSTKAYAQNLGETADFTVMFLPNESFLYAALETQTDLIEFGLERKILIATPPTLIGLLKVVRFGWNEVKISENSKKIFDLAARLQKRLLEFSEGLVGVNKGLGRAQDEFDTSMRRLNNYVLPLVRELEILGGAEARPSVEGVDSPAQPPPQA